MTNKRFTDAQVTMILQQAEDGAAVSELCKKHGMCKSSFYKWRSKSSYKDTDLTSRLQELESENRLLKKMYAEERLKLEIIKEAHHKKR